MERSENILEEIRGAGHEQIAKSVEVCAVAHFLSEYVWGISFAGDMWDGDSTIFNPFAGRVFLVFDVTITFCGQFVAPLHALFAVIVEWSGYVSVVDRVTKRLEMEDHIP